MAYDLWNLAKPFDRATLRQLRPRQEAAVEAIRRAASEGHNRIVLQLPTGGGKTLIAAHLIGSALEKGKLAVFVCPSINLVSQTIAAFELEGIRDVGAIQAAHERTDRHAQVQVASVQSLVRRKLPEADFIIIDEVHQMFRRFNEILDGEWAGKIAVGLSATPWARGMGLRWGKLIVAATTRELIAEGWLSPFKGYGPGLEADLKNVRITAGDFNEGDLSGVMARPELVADIVKTWLLLGENRSTFLYAVDRAHAAELQREFLKSGVSCGYIDGFSTPEEREKTFRKFRSGEDRIIASVGCLIAGIDEDVRCIIVARPTKSEILHCQMLGRGLRTAEGKDTCVFLDHAGNCERLGLPDAIHHDKLDMRKPGENGGINPEESKPVTKPSRCKSCNALIPPGSKQCPQCGALRVRQSAVEVADGELVAFGDLARMAPKSAKERIAALGKQEVFGMLAAYARRHQYKDGWASNKYRDIFGVWPHTTFPPFIEKIAPELSSWLTAEHIRFAKGRGGGRARAG